MSVNSLNKGDINCCDGRAYHVWEVTKEFYGLLPYPEDDDINELVVHYVVHDFALT